MYTVCVSQGGWTALISASDMGHLEVVKALLEAGADKEVKGNVSEDNVHVESLIM